MNTVFNSGSRRVSIVAWVLVASACKICWRTRIIGLPKTKNSSKIMNPELLRGSPCNYGRCIFFIYRCYVTHNTTFCHLITIMIMKLLSYVYMVFNCIYASHCSVKQFYVGRMQVFFEITSSIQKHCSSVWTTKMHLLFHTFCYLHCSTILQRGAARSGRNGCLYPRHS